MNRMPTNSSKFIFTHLAFLKFSSLSGHATVFIELKVDNDEELKNNLIIGLDKINAAKMLFGCSKLSSFISRSSKFFG